MSRGRTVGVLIVARKLEGSFTSEEVDFLSEASGQIAIAIENCFAYREIFELKEKLAQEKLYLEDEIRSDMNFEQIVENSPALKHVLQLVETVAPSDSTVLLLGETGTGKELIARAIHDRSRRKDRTFVKVNCAAIPTGSWRASYLVTKREHLRAPLRKRSADSNWPTKAPSSWTRWATFRLKYSRSCCVHCRNASLNG
jgi:transcriptional regulator with GAF, ATPase, and Fis domain